MIAFTTLGLVFFWMFCWQVGQAIAQFIYAKDLIDKAMEPITSEINAVISVMETFNATKGDSK